ncbi:sugar transferase [Arthrobacter sp. GMC3]|uniref:sugar transferase n=1 Tax=Arthrobacter sp. GMC3 TaxID=2058894 RepID=UPI000CE2C0DA|nr:sugar transferase [Arthrobacter sp. GMC3]
MGAVSGWHKSYGWKLRITDSIVIIVAISVAYVVWFQAGITAASANDHPNGYFVTGLVLLAIWTFDLELHRTRETRVFGIGATEYRRVVQSTLRVFGAMAIIMVVVDVRVVRGFFAIALPLGLVLLLGSRWLWRRWLAGQRNKGRCLSDVVVLGTADDVAYVIGQLKSNLSAGYKVVGVALASLHEKVELRPPWHKIPVLSTMADIGRVLAVTGAQTVIVAGPLPGGPSTIQELGWRLEDMSTELVLASNLTNIAGPRVHFRPIEGLPLMHVELPRYSGGKHIIKRVMDMVLAAAALLILSPLLIILAIIVGLDSPGPVLFRQERVGRQGAAFKMFKFRSMVVDAEAQLDTLAEHNQGAGVLFKMANDPRITRCGAWMRKYSLDELPQFWNVLMGQMSLVGPRPPLKTEVDGYEKPAHRRLLIKPGITGLWQISGRSNLAWDEAVRLDLYYVENWSLTGDFIILWRTFKAVYDPKGAY